MKQIKRIILLLLLAMCIIPRNISMATVDQGAGPGVSTGSGSASTAAAALTGLDTQGTTADVSGLKTVIGRLVSFLQIASGLVAVLMIAITGFNYIIGTPDVKDEMKKKMLPIIIGLILVFGAVSIAKFILGAVGGGS